LNPLPAAPCPLLHTLPTTGRAAASSVCEIDVPDVAVDGASLLICLCGLVGNGAVLWLLGCRIRRNPITVYVLNLAVADFIFLLLMLTSAIFYILDSLSCHTFHFFSYLTPFFLPLLFTHNMGMYLLTAISIERCVSVLCPLWYRCHRPQHLSAVVCALLWALSISVIAIVAVPCLTHQQDQCRLSLISMYALNFLIFAPPMVISNVILFIKVQCGSQRRQPRRLYIVIFLTVLFFLLLMVPLSIWNFVQHINISMGHSQVVFLLACINSSINPFIYFLVGSCRRRCSLVSLQVAFRRVFEETGVTVISS
uniref:G-protein coupled receptors family 1 profile domain-containing protein n=1 Tax=Anas platyrhynchos TaxID=8839 RepID=A0A8B9QSF2_ANAPL